ncbi:hypothetical protein [Sedimenticola thiotaurini]|uniref:Uncharacterized protein n=1 Tax=Sedimenticola thiotaurini TaxID=1543721 RepID=A0A0F7JY29_9GAMM|nr:hypothetical protein [Sedimenticola thiotaurini]AKH21316.1 hypothetical protein AAY24_14135 [Sedimenticola thiotaurini]
MSKTNYWHGYLEAGKKSSPVLRDPSLETGNANTVYLYSLNRDKILEFQAAIVEKKLRDLGEHESDLISSLNAGYKKAKKEFTPRASMRLKQVELTPQATADSVKPELEDGIDDAVLDDDLDIDIDVDDD